MLVNTIKNFSCSFCFMLVRVYFVSFWSFNVAELYEVIYMINFMIKLDGNCRCSSSVCYDSGRGKLAY